MARESGLGSTGVNLDPGLAEREGFEPSRGLRP
jgi:hypothetical protein